jgi:5'-deoxynucleotidase YfbR-like HD superfamily hydrolase
VVHDLAEASVGDITPFDGITKEAKQKLEEVRFFLASVSLY